MISICCDVLLRAGITFGAVSVSAGEADGHAETHKMVVAVKTDDFELVETDISDLGIGDAETIHTESGKTIDLHKTEDGVEIYVDGELIDTGLEALIDEHVDEEHLHDEGENKRVIVIKRKVESS